MLLGFETQPNLQGEIPLNAHSFSLVKPLLELCPTYERISTIFMEIAILNKSEGKWAFTGLADILCKSLWVDVSEEAKQLNYVLCIGSDDINTCTNSFIPLDSIKIASDKRKIEKRFLSHNVKRPRTFILESLIDVKLLLDKHSEYCWILKYPIGCGGMHHRIIKDVDQIPEAWERPFLIQEFIECSLPEVYRVYCIDEDLFGFNVRRFDSANNTSPWVSHANGARYVYGENASKDMIEVAKKSLIATGLYSSFGVVDLIKDINDNWYSLEVGTDGIYNYVDRDLDNKDLFDEINERLAIAFWKRVGSPPWGRCWQYRD